MSTKKLFSRHKNVDFKKVSFGTLLCLDSVHDFRSSRPLRRRHDFLLTRPTANLSFEALNEPFFYRLDVFRNVSNLKTTLVAFISAPGGDKVECRGSEQNVAPVVTPVTFQRRE